MQKTKLIKAVAIKSFGDKPELLEIERLLEKYYTTTTRGVIYNEKFKNFEQWIDIYKEN
jgi:hypothetical protein